MDDWSWWWLDPSLDLCLYLPCAWSLVCDCCVHAYMHIITFITKIKFKELRSYLKIFANEASFPWNLFLRDECYDAHVCMNETITHKGSHTRKTQTKVKGWIKSSSRSIIHFGGLWFSPYQHPSSIDIDETWSDQPRIKGFVVSHEHGVRLRTILKEFIKDKNL